MDGDKPANAVHHNTINILNSDIVHDLKKIPIRDPDSFVSGGINQNSDEWLPNFGDDLPIQIKGWVTNDVDVNDFFKPFKGNFKENLMKERDNQKLIFITLLHADYLYLLLRKRLRKG